MLASLHEKTMVVVTIVKYNLP